MPAVATLVIAAAVLAGGLGGCGMSSLTSGIGGGMFGGSAAKSEAPSVNTDSLLTAAKSDQPEAAATADIAGGCPKFTIRTRDGQVTIYEAGRVGDGLAVMHRGEITKTARECRLENNRVFIKYGFSGKVLLGPRGKTGNVQLTVMVTDAKRERVTQDAVKIDVPVALDKPIGYFSAVREVSFPVPEGARAGEFEVQVGFDRNIPGAG
jgi:hypothetical protein